MVGVGVDYMSPINLVAYRLVIGAVLVTGYAYSIGQRFPKLSDQRWRWYFMLGITGSVLPFFLLSTGQVTVDSGIASIIVGAMPIMTIILAHFFASERLTPMKMLGFFIGFLGIVILFLPDDLSLSIIGDWKAQMLCIGGAMCYAFTTVFAKRVPPTPSAIGGAMMLICAAIIGVIAAFITGLPSESPAMMGHLMALGLGVGSTGIATVLYLWVIEKSGPTMIAKINYFTPVASVILGVWLLNEPVTWRVVLSFAIIILGILIARKK
jgi:drug/metabolite transporter (DMT)-like permease